MAEEIDYSRVDTRFYGMPYAEKRTREVIADIWLGQNLARTDEDSYKEIERIYREQNGRAVDYADAPGSSAARNVRSHIMAAMSAPVAVGDAVSDPAMQREFQSLPDQVLNRLYDRNTKELDGLYQQTAQYRSRADVSVQHDSLEAGRRLMAAEIMHRDPARSEQVTSGARGFISSEAFNLVAQHPESRLWIPQDREHAAEAARLEAAAQHAARPPAKGHDLLPLEGRASFGASRAVAMLADFAPEHSRERFAIALDEAECGIATRAIEQGHPHALRTSLWTIDAGLKEFLAKIDNPGNGFYDAEKDGLVMTRWSYSNKDTTDLGAVTFRGKEALDEFRRAATGFGRNGRPTQDIASLHVFCHDEGKVPNQVSTAWKVQASLLDAVTAAHSSHDLKTIAKTRFSDPDPRAVATVAWVQKRFPRSSATTLSEVARIAKDDSISPMGSKSWSVLQLPEIARRAEVHLRFEDPYGSGDYSPSLKSNLVRQDWVDLKEALTAKTEVSQDKADGHKQHTAVSSPRSSVEASATGSASASSSDRAPEAPTGSERPNRTRIFGNLVSVSGMGRGVEAKLQVKDGERSVVAWGGAAAALRSFKPGDRLQLSVEDSANQAQGGKLKATYVAKAEPYKARTSKPSQLGD